MEELKDENKVNIVKDEKDVNVVPLKITGNKNLDMKILSYLEYDKLLMLEKHSPGLWELMGNPKFWILKLEHDFGVDVMKYRTYKCGHMSDNVYKIEPKNYRNLYIAQCKLDKLLKNPVMNSIHTENFFGMLGTISYIFAVYKITEIEAEYMFILSNLGEMLDLKDYSLTEMKVYTENITSCLLKILFSIFYLVTFDINDINKQIHSIIKLYSRPELIYMLVAFHDKGVREITKSFLKTNTECLTEVEKYLETKGYLEKFRGFLKIE